MFRWRGCMMERLVTEECADDRGPARERRCGGSREGDAFPRHAFQDSPFCGSSLRLLTQHCAPFKGVHVRLIRRMRGTVGWISGELSTQGSSFSPSSPCTGLRLSLPDTVWYHTLLHGRCTTHAGAGVPPSKQPDPDTARPATGLLPGRGAVWIAQRLAT